MALKVLNPINNVDLSRLAQVPGILLSDLLGFADLSATAPQLRQLTVQQFLDAVIPTLTLTMLPTGLVMDFGAPVAPSGWLLCSGRTIGSSTSGATERANTDTLALFTFLWTYWTNVTAPIFTSAGSASTRGASANADWSANKRLSLPDLRGRVTAGKDDMGGTAANILTLANGLDGLTIGAVGGEQVHTLLATEIPAHTHNTAVPTTTSASAATGADKAIPGATAPITSDNGTGGGLAHNNTQPTLILSKIIKL